MRLIINWIYLSVKKLEPLLLPFIFFSGFTILLPALLLSSYSFSAFTSANNWSRSVSFLNSLALSSFISLCALVITLLLSFVLAILIWHSCSEINKKKLLLILVFPLVSNYFIRLIGLKSCFDFFNGSLNSTYSFGYTIIGLVYLSFPLVCFNFLNTLSAIPKEKSWAVRDLGQTFRGEIFHLLLPWTKTTFWSSSALVFLPSLFTTFISEFLNHDMKTRMIGETISELSNSTAWTSEKPFIAFLVSLLFTISILGVVFWVSLVKGSLFCLKSIKSLLFSRNKKIELVERGKRSFSIAST